MPRVVPLRERLERRVRRALAHRPRELEAVLRDLAAVRPGELQPERRHQPADRAHDEDARAPEPLLQARPQEVREVGA